MYKKKEKNVCRKVHRQINNYFEQLNNQMKIFKVENSLTGNDSIVDKYTNQVYRVVVVVFKHIYEQLSIYAYAMFVFILWLLVVICE